MTQYDYLTRNVVIPEESFAKLQRIQAQDKLAKAEKRKNKRKAKLTGRIIQNMFPTIPIVDDGFQILSVSELGKYASNPDQENLANNSFTSYFLEQNSEITKPTYGAAYSPKTPLDDIFKD